jgi:endonuclease/exonuclease/phosphatase family metal-dependent hydrolase
VTGAGRVRMLHWNIHSWRDDAGAPNHAAVTGLIRETAPDVVSLVEVGEPWGAPSALGGLAGVTFCPSPPEPTHPARRAVRPIDYCLASPAVRAEARVLRTAGSDHWPVLVSARVPGGAWAGTGDA